MKRKHRLTVNEAARLMGVSDQYVRIGIQRGLLPFGTAVKMSSRWTYFISKENFEKVTGIKVDQEEYCALS